MFFTRLFKGQVGSVFAQGTGGGPSSSPALCKALTGYNPTPTLNYTETHFKHTHTHINIYLKKNQTYHIVSG